MGEIGVMLVGIFVVSACVGAGNAAARTWQGFPFVMALLGSWFFFFWSAQRGGLTDAEYELLGLTMTCGVTGFVIGEVVVPASRRRRQKGPAARTVRQRP